MHMSGAPCAWHAAALLNGAADLPAAAFNEFVASVQAQHDAATSPEKIKAAFDRVGQARSATVRVLGCASCGCVGVHTDAQPTYGRYPISAPGALRFNPHNVIDQEAYNQFTRANLKMDVLSGVRQGAVLSRALLGESLHFAAA